MSQDGTVQLYLYDLSNGMAASMSRQLIGKHIPAVWHSSIVVFGEEIYFGQGIQRCRPGGSHHGAPLKVVQLGTTGIDKDTFHEYLASLQPVYTADKYHLLDYNCNTFTNDVSNFLTGNSIPQDVIDLPKEFLSTPFGASLRPYIDSLFRGQMQGSNGLSPGQQPSGGIPPQLAQAISGNPILEDGLRSVQQAANGAHPALTNGAASNASTPRVSGSNGILHEPLASSLTVATNMASFQSLLARNAAVTVMFTGDWCGPCKVVKPVFERLAQRSAAEPPVTFVLVDTTAGREIAAQHNISAVPTFMFFHKGKKIKEIRGADAGELRTQVGLLAMTAYPPHPHMTLRDVDHLKAMSTAPILFEQVPNIDAATAKLQSFLPPSDANLQPAFAVFKDTLPHITSKSLSKATAVQQKSLVSAFAVLAKALDVPQLFPLLDVLKYAIIQDDFATLLAESPADGVQNLVSSLIRRLASEAGDIPKATLITMMRLVCNSLANSILADSILSSSETRSHLLKVLVRALLTPDKPLRACAASLAHSIVGWLRTHRKIWISDEADGVESGLDLEDFEMELCTATLEALDREDIPEIAHRLVAALGGILLFSPHYDVALQPLLQALEGKRIVQSKREIFANKPDALKLIPEVASLCE